MYRELLEQAPAFIWTRIYLGKTLLARGDAQAALAMVRQEPDEPIRLLYLPIVRSGRRPARTSLPRPTPTAAIVTSHSIGSSELTNRKTPDWAR